jgi:hypothetical protein
MGTGDEPQGFDEIGSELRGGRYSLPIRPSNSATNFKGPRSRLARTELVLSDSGSEHNSGLYPLD